MKTITKEKWEALTPEEKLRYSTASLRNCSVAIANVGREFSNLSDALLGFVDACGPGRDWKISKL